MRRHLNNLKGKPEHVRRNVAMGASVGITALVAVVWFAAHAASGTFALGSPGPAGEEETLGEGRGSFTELLGAVGGSLGTTSTEPELTIVDGNTTSTLSPAPASQNQTDQTVIPF